ncbi:bifunctional RNase H/acid phosphatase [Corynebacterium qintianiae]|uniref:phosphoglycerate mutase (2,3-diphosphoglycerate-dependent) n=1 Tax=Corynebacterium qintianiae TaxID=2709392 RepID=A0A7T0KMW7_9CORY|nr:bifunctional RNase H/acid phosphatase [Corynebacterium qintianiae]QPK82743.1 bifunctional RNase H/acid phosphatase [Corynebacterium qintianiae]
MQVKVYTDGGSRGNPGVAGSGSVVYGPDGETLAEVAYVVGQKSSNNVAEYHGLLRGLEAARDLGATSVEVYMDSELVVEQMSGRWKIKHPDMKELALVARGLAAGFSSVSYNWVPRAKNKKADELSNVAMDAAAKGAKPGVVGAAPSPGKQHVVAGPAHWSGTDAPRTRFVLLRHGQTEHSAAKLYSGSSDPALTDVGVEQAERAAQAVAAMGSIDAIVTSPQTRARQTAEACAAALGITVSEVETAEGFREMDYGDFEGLSRAECVERFGEEFDAWQASTSAAPPNGESLAALHRRVTRARLALQEKYEGGTVLVVTHMTPVKSVIRQALGVGAEAFKHIFLDLASVSVVEFYGDFGVVRCVNDVAHHR